jgi:branched-chain amino acid transport system permease protein
MRTPLRRPLLVDGTQTFIGIVLVVTSIVAPGLYGSQYWAHNFLIVSLFVGVAVLQNMLLSDAGQVSFGQGAVFGLAAYMVGIVSELWGHGYAIGALAGIGAAVLLGLLLALPALRVQGYYLGFVTLSAAVVFPQMLVALNDITNGINGITVAVPALTAENSLGLNWMSLLVGMAAASALIFHTAFRSTRTGRRMRVAASSPEAAMTLGINAGGLRFLAFSLAAFGTGIAGVLYVPILGFVSPYAFRVDLSIFFFFSVVVGGSGQLLGPVIGAWILFLVPNALLAGWSDYRLLGYGIVALVIMLAFPDGVVGSLAEQLRRRRMRTQVPPVELDRIRRQTEGMRAASRSGGPAIKVRGARKTFGRLAALGGVDLTVVAGQVHGLVGPNGSGKTTLLNAISGLAPLDGGTIHINGNDTTRSAAHRLAGRGVGRTFQTPRIFDGMSIWENLMIGADAAPGHISWLLSAVADNQAAWSASRPDVLPHAQRRVLEIMRVVATDADILLLDEPAAGLSPEERRDFADMVRLLRDRFGKTILLVEHDLDLVWRVADRISVLDAGLIVAEGPPDAIHDDPRVRALFTGTVDA